MPQTRGVSACSSHEQSAVRARGLTPWSTCGSNVCTNVSDKSRAGFVWLSGDVRKPVCFCRFAALLYVSEEVVTYVAQFATRVAEVFIIEDAGHNTKIALAR